MLAATTVEPVGIHPGELRGGSGPRRRRRVAIAGIDSQTVGLKCSDDAGLDPETVGSDGLSQAAMQEHDEPRCRRSDPDGQAVTRMRLLAKAPTPTWWPPISTVIVPSGEAAVTLPV